MAHGEADVAALTRDQADANILKGGWRRRAADGGGACAGLEHARFAAASGCRSLFECLFDISREREAPQAPDSAEAMRCAIAEYMDRHGGALQFGGVQYCASDSSSANGHGSVSEALAFAMMFSVSIDIHSPETSEHVLEFHFGHSDAAPELLLQFFGWHENGDIPTLFGHWQRLTSSSPADQHHVQPALPSGAITSRRHSMSSNEWERLLTSSGEAFLRHKVSGEIIKDLHYIDSIFSNCSNSIIKSDSVSFTSNSATKTHHKIKNPQNFPLPQCCSVILKDRVFLEGQDKKKSIKERLTQLSITVDNHIELAYAQDEGLTHGTDNLQNVVRLTRGIGSLSGAPPLLAAKVSNTKNGRGEFKFCLRIDMARPDSSSPLKLVMCFKTDADRSLWHDAFAWADCRWSICRQHDECTAAGHEEQVLAVDVVCAEPHPTPSFCDFGHIPQVTDASLKDAIGPHGSVDLTNFLQPNRKFLNLSETEVGEFRTLPVDVMPVPVSPSCLSKMVSLAHSSIRRTIGHISEANGLFAVLEHAVSPSVDALWLSPPDFVGISLRTRSQWVLSIAQAVAFIHLHRVSHEPFDLSKSIAFFSDSSCKLLVIPCEGLISLESDRHFVVSFAVNILMSHPDRGSSSIDSNESPTRLGTEPLSNMNCFRLLRDALSDSGRLVGGMPVSSYDSEFDVILHEALNPRSDSAVLANAWMLIYNSLCSDRPELSLLDRECAFFSWLEYLSLQQQNQFSTEAQDRFERRATAKDPKRFIISSLYVDPDKNTPLFNQFSDQKSPISSKREALLMLLAFIQSIPENRSRYVQAGFLEHMLLLMSKNSSRRIQADDQMQEFCLNILAHILGSTFFIGSSGNADEQKLAEDVCRLVCDVLLEAVALEVQHSALICLHKFSLSRVFHPIIFASALRDQYLVLCLKCTTQVINPSHQLLSIHVSQLASQILMNLYLGEFAADIQERKVPVAEPGCFVPRSIFEIFDILFKRLIEDKKFSLGSSFDRLDNLFEAVLKFCAILAIDSSNHHKFWDINHPLAVTIAKNVKSFPSKAFLHVSNMLKDVSSSIDTESNQKYWNHLLGNDYAIPNCTRVVLNCIKQLIGLFPSSCATLDESIFCALMQFSRMADFVDQFAIQCDEILPLPILIKAARTSSLAAGSSFLSAVINIIIWDDNCTITPKFLKAGLLSLPFFTPNLRVFSKDASFYMKVAKCIQKILSKEDEFSIGILLESECIETLVSFISHLDLTYEDSRMQRVAFTVCSCFKYLSKNPIACLKLVTIGSAGCLPLIIEYFLPNSIEDTRIECLLAILGILTQCRVMINNDNALQIKISKYLCFSEGILGILLTYIPKPELSFASNPLQQECIFRCLANLCALTGSNHEIILKFIIENPVYRADFLDALCNFQIDDPSRVPALQLVVELAKLNDMRLPDLPPDISRFSVSLFEHIPFQTSINFEINRISVNCDVLSLYARIICFFTLTKEISESVRKVFWPVIVSVLERYKSEIVSITKRMQSDFSQRLIHGKAENEETLIFVCSQALCNMSLNASSSSYPSGFGYDVLPVLVLLIHEPSPCRIVALDIISTLAIELGHEIEFMRTIVELPDLHHSVLSTVAQVVYCDSARLNNEERLKCVAFFSTCCSNYHDASILLHRILMQNLEIDSDRIDGGLSGDYYESLILSLSRYLPHEHILNTLGVIHSAIKCKIEQGLLADVTSTYFNSKLIQALGQLVLPLDSPISFKAIEVLADIMDPKPFEIQPEKHESAAVLAHLWPHFVSIVSTNSPSSSESLIRAVSKILVSRISIRNATCIGFDSTSLWTMNAIEIVAVAKSAMYCIQQKCILVCSLRRFIASLIYPSSVSSTTKVSQNDTEDAISSIIIEETVSFLIDMVHSTLQTKGFTSGGSPSVQLYMAEHAAFVLMHISAYLCRTGETFQRSCVKIFVALLMSLTDVPQMTNFEIYILVCLHYVVLSPNRAMMIIAADFEKPTLWDRIIKRMNLFVNYQYNGNDIPLLIPGMTLPQVTLGLFDGMLDCSENISYFLQRYVRIPFGVVSPYLRSTVAAERHHALSILCKLAQVSYQIPALVLDFWRHPNAEDFVRSILEIMDSSELMTDREHSCAFMYFSTKHTKDRSDSWNEVCELFCQFTFGQNTIINKVSPLKILSECLFHHFPGLKISSLQFLRNISLISLRASSQGTQLLIHAFQQHSYLFIGLANLCSIESQQDESIYESFVPSLCEEFQCVGLLHGRFRLKCIKVILEFFQNLSSIVDLVNCFANEDVIQAIVKQLSSPLLRSCSLNTDSTSVEVSSDVIPKHIFAAEVRSDSVDMSHDLKITKSNLQSVNATQDFQRDDFLISEFRMLAINVIINLCQHDGSDLLDRIENAGIVPILIDIIKDESSTSDFSSNCLIVLGKVANSEQAKCLMEHDFEFLSRLASSLNFSGGFKRLGSTLHLLILLREITKVQSICNFFVLSSNVSIFYSILEIFERDFEESKLQALAVLSNLVSNDRIKAEISKSKFLTLIVEAIKRPTALVHLQFSLAALLNVITNHPANQYAVASAAGLIEELCKYYLDPSVGSDDDNIKSLVSELLIILSNCPSAISEGLYQRCLITRTEPFIRLLCRIVCYQASNNGPSKLASLRLLYTTSITSTNVSIIAEYMVEECRNHLQFSTMHTSIFENLVLLLASTSSSEREIAANIFSGVAKIFEWADFFSRWRPRFHASLISSLILPSAHIALIPALLHSGSQLDFPRESLGAITALSYLAEHEQHLCDIVANDPALDCLLSVLASNNIEASIKASIIFSHIGACAKTQSIISRNESLVQSLAEILPSNSATGDIRIKSIISCFYHISKCNDSTLLSALCQNRVLCQIVQQFGSSVSLNTCEILLNICLAFKSNSGILDQVVRAGSIVTVINTLVAKNFESKIVLCCFELLSVLKSVPGVLIYFFDNVTFLEIVCTSIYPKFDMIEAALLLQDLSAVKDHRHKLFSCINLVKDACKFLLRSSGHSQHGTASPQEICIGANILSNLAEDYCHLDDFSSFFNFFPEHMWYRQNFMNTEVSQSPNAQVQECCSRAIFTLCEGETECFQINQVACANSCLSQLYGLLEFGASDLAKINSARSLCAITALSQKKEIRSLLTGKISPAQLWHVPLLVIRQRDPEDAVRFCLGLISHLVENPERGSELAMVPVEKIGGITKHIEWTLFRSLNCEELSERLYAMRILASICVKKSSEGSTAISDMMANDISRRIMKCNIACGIFKQLMEQFLSSNHEQEKEHICTIFERFSLSSEFESQVRSFDPDFLFLSEVIKSPNINISTLGCSMIRNAYASSSTFDTTSNYSLLSAMCAYIECDDPRTEHVLQTLLLLASATDISLIPVFDQVSVITSIVKQLGSSKSEFREMCCKILLAASDSDDVGPRNMIMVSASPFPLIVSIIKSMPWMESKIPLLLLSKLSVFPDAQAFLQRDLSFVKDLAFNITHCKASDSEKQHISLASLICIAKVTRDYGPSSKAHLKFIFSCPQILSSAKECLDLGHDLQKVSFLIHAMEIFYNMSLLESSHKEMLDRRHQLIPLWCRLFDHFSQPGQSAQVSFPTLHLQYTLLVLGNLIQSKICPLEPFTIFSVNSSFHKNLEVLFNKHCSSADNSSDLVPSINILTLRILQLFIQDREVRKKIMELEQSEVSTIIKSMHVFLSRKQSRIPNADVVIDYVLHFLCDITTSAEYLPLVILKTQSTGVHVFLEYLRLSNHTLVRVNVLKILQNFSRCSDDASIATISGAGGIKHLIEVVLNTFKRPSASTIEMHLCMSILFNMRHTIRLDSFAKGFLLHPKEDEYRNKIILTSRAPHSDPLGASIRLICLKIILLLLEFCEMEENHKCAFNIGFKLLTPKTPAGLIQQSIIDIAMLSNIQNHSSSQSVNPPVDFLGQIVTYGEFVLADIEKPLIEGCAERLYDIEKAISQHACLIMSTIFCSAEPKLEEVLLKVSENSAKLYEPIIPHITDVTCLPVVIRSCKALACLSRNSKYTHLFSDPSIINALLMLLDKPTTLRFFSHNDLNDILDAIHGFSKNPKCIPFNESNRVIGILSGWFSRAELLQYKLATLEIIEQMTRSDDSSSPEFDTFVLAVAENPKFGLAFISEQLGLKTKNIECCLSILCNILASQRVRELITKPTSFHNFTEILCRLVRSEDALSKPALTCLTLLCHNSDLTCALIATDVIESIMHQIMKNASRGYSSVQQSDIDALRFLQFVFRARLRVVQMFELVPLFFQEIVSIASTDNESARQYTSRMILSICAAEERSVFDVLVQKDLCSYVSALRDSQSEHCALIATQIAGKMLMSPSCVLSIEQRSRLFLVLQCGSFSRFECNWPTQQAPTTLKCAFEGSDHSNKVNFSCVALPGGHFNIRSIQELIVAELESPIGSVYCIISVPVHPTMHIILLKYRDVILQFLDGLRVSSADRTLDSVAAIQLLTTDVAEFSKSTTLDSNFLLAVVTLEQVVWSSISTIPGLAKHRLFLPSSSQFHEQSFDTVIGSALVCHADRPASRSCIVVGSEGFSRYMSDAQVADVISVYALNSPAANSEHFLSAVKDLVNISTLGSCAGVRVDDDQVPECSCLLLHLHSQELKLLTSQHQSLST